MGDLSAEPSMEEILSSIKRIIAEEGDSAPGRPRRQQRAAPAGDRTPSLDDAAVEDQVLELSDPMPTSRPPVPQPEATRSEALASEVTQLDVTRPEATRPAPVADAARERAAPWALVSEGTAAASRGALDQLGRLMVKPEPGSDGSLEGLVRDMLRPMLSEWLDANLPALVETMVQREIKRITGAGG